MSSLLCTVTRLVLGRYLIKNGCSSFLMPALHETVVQVAHSYYKFHHVVVVVFHDVIVMLLAPASSFQLPQNITR